LLYADAYVNVFASKKYVYYDMGEQKSRYFSYECCMFHRDFSEDERTIER
jgi:hypothetical protein